MVHRILLAFGAVGLAALVALFGMACGAAAPTPTKAPTGATPAPGAAVPAPYKGKTNPLAVTDQAAVSAGKKIYDASCTSCHGEKGDGKGLVGASLKPPPADFTSAASQQALDKEQDRLLWRVSEGKEGTAMPAFKSQLKENEIWQVLTYIKSLTKK
ncbi:MAG: cytochrome c [Chloroflexi bacterium]|nr:cytochrome c [Chloroflexota bacterium]